MAFVISKMTKEQAKDILSKVKTEIYRRSGFAEDGNNLHEEKFRNYNGPISDDPSLLNFDWYEIPDEKVSEGYDTDVIRSLQGGRSIDKLLEISDFDDAKFVKEFEGIPGAFDYDNMNTLLDKLSKEGFTDTNTSCRSACTGLCEGACSASCTQGCSDTCTGCGDNCISGCSTQCTGCSVSCGTSCGGTCGTGCTNSAVSCTDCTGGCNGCSGCTGCIGNCSASLGATTCSYSCSSGCHGNCQGQSLGSNGRVSCGCGSGCTTMCGSSSSSSAISSSYTYQQDITFQMSNDVILQMAFSRESMYHNVTMPSVTPRTPAYEYFSRQLIGWVVNYDTSKIYNPGSSYRIYSSEGNKLFRAYERIYNAESSQSLTYSSPSEISPIMTTVTYESEFNLKHDSPVKIIAYDNEGNQVNGYDNDSFVIMINETNIAMPFNAICKSGDIIKIKIINKEVISKVTVEYFDLKGSSDEMIIPAQSVVEFSIESALFSYNEDGKKSLVKSQKSNASSEILQITLNDTTVDIKNTKYLKISSESTLKYKINEKYFVSRDRHLMSFGIHSLSIVAKTYSTSNYDTSVI